jgi:hypothetical protein
MRVRIFVLSCFVGLMSSMPVHAAVTFDGDWQGFGEHFVRKDSNVSWLVDTDPGHWRNVQEKSTNRIIAVQDLTSPLKGTVARVEVRPGDNVGWSGERAEVLNMQRSDPQTGKTDFYPVLESDGHEFYAIAVKLSPDWVPPGKDHGTGPVWGTIAQLHAPDTYDAPPALALSATSDFHLDWCAGDIMDGGNLSTHKDSVPLAFTNGALNAGHWVEFVIEVIWSYTNKGGVTVYRRDEGERNFGIVYTKYQIPTLQSKYGATEDDSHHYWKVGYYRSTTAQVTNVLWMGPFVRGTTFDEVARAAFGSL